LITEYLLGDKSSDDLDSMHPFYSVLILNVSLYFVEAVFGEPVVDGVVLVWFSYSKVDHRI
jgi:hypothetical protein